MFALGNAKINNQIFKGSFVTLFLYEKGTYIATSQSETFLSKNMYIWKTQIISVRCYFAGAYFVGFA